MSIEHEEVAISEVQLRAAHRELLTEHPFRVGKLGGPDLVVDLWPGFVQPEMTPEEEAMLANHRAAVSKKTIFLTRLGFGMVVARFARAQHAAPTDAWRSVLIDTRGEVLDDDLTARR